MLTTKEVEQLVQLSRVTIYRLIREENFPAVKIGGQWRFSEEQVKAWMDSHYGVTRPTEVCDTSEIAIATLFNTVEITSLLEAFARALNLSAFVVDRHGNLLAECPSCQHPFCQFMRTTAAGNCVTCEANVRQIVSTDVARARLLGCAFGLKYLQSPLTVNDEIGAYVLMGPILMLDDSAGESQQSLAALARDVGDNPESVRRYFEDVHQFSTEQIRILVDLLSQVMHTMLEVVSNRLHMVERINEIAQLVADRSR